ncbi:YgjP-like metallopeptidase domain-containing protein [Sulfurospirillum multivorans]
MIHLLERYHNDNFKSLMDKYMPNWIERKKLLEYYPLCCC